MGGLKEQTSLEYGLALSSVKGLGNTQIKHLITHFGGIQAVFDAEAPDIAQLPSSYPALVSQILALTENLPKFRDHLDTLRNENIRGLCLADLVYPARLKAIPDRLRFSAVWANSQRLISMLLATQ